MYISGQVEGMDEYMSASVTVEGVCASIMLSYEDVI